MTKVNNIKTIEDIKTILKELGKRLDCIEVYILLKDEINYKNTRKDIWSYD